MTEMPLAIGLQITVKTWPELTEALHAHVGDVVAALRGDLMPPEWGLAAERYRLVISVGGQDIVKVPA